MVALIRVHINTADLMSNCLLVQIIAKGLLKDKTNNLQLLPPIPSIYGWHWCRGENSYSVFLPQCKNVHISSLEFLNWLSMWIISVCVVMDWLPVHVCIPVSDLGTTGTDSNDPHDPWAAVQKNVDTSSTFTPQYRESNRHAFKKTCNTPILMRTTI